MNVSAPFIRRPVGTALLTAAVALAGAVAYLQLPVAPLPQVDYPAINVQASLPGASPEIMASSVAAPLERQLGHIAGVNEMTSSSTLGSSSIQLQFARRATSRPPSMPRAPICRRTCRAIRLIAKSIPPTRRS